MGICTVNESVYIDGMGQTINTNGSAPRTKRANIIPVFTDVNVHANHGGRWSPGTGQYALIDVMAARFNCTTTRQPDRETGRDGVVRDYGRVVRVHGSAANVARVVNMYGPLWDDTYTTARLTWTTGESSAANAETCNPDGLTWGPFINSFANGVARTYADMCGVANAIAERPHAATTATGAAFVTAMHAIAARTTKRAAIADLPNAADAAIETTADADADAAIE